MKINEKKKYNVQRYKQKTKNCPLQAVVCFVDAFSGKKILIMTNKKKKTILYFLNELFSLSLVNSIINH
jgi:hypothetical protein